MGVVCGIDFFQPLTVKELLEHAKSAAFLTWIFDECGYGDFSHFGDGSGDGGGYWEDDDELFDGDGSTDESRLGCGSGYGDGCGYGEVYGSGSGGAKDIFNSRNYKKALG